MTTLNKAAWRVRIRSTRRTAAANGPRMELVSGSAQAVLAWLETLDGGTAAICAYISTGAEPPTERLLEALVESGRAVYIPVCEPGQHLSWVSWRGTKPVGLVQEPVGQRHTIEEFGALSAFSSRPWPSMLTVFA